MVLILELRGVRRALPLHTHSERTDEFFKMLLLNPLLSTWVFAACFYRFWAKEDEQSSAPPLSHECGRRIRHSCFSDDCSASLHPLACPCTQLSFSGALFSRLLGKWQQQLLPESLYARLFHNRCRVLAVESPLEYCPVVYSFTFYFSPAGLCWRPLSH